MLHNMLVYTIVFGKFVQILKFYVAVMKYLSLYFIPCCYQRLL